MILFSDFDGTLHPRDDEEKIFLSNLRAVQEFRAAGNKFYLATGRSLSSLKRAWPDYHDYLDGMLLDNGSVCIDSDNKIVFQTGMPKSLVNDIIEFANKADPDGNRTQFVFYYDLSEHAGADGVVTKIRYWISGESFAEEIFAAFQEKFDQRAYAFLMRHAFSPDHSWAREELNLTSFIEIVDRAAGKENGVRDFAKHYGLPHGEIITVGDDTNDAVMIQEYNGYVVRKPGSRILELVPPDHVVNSVGELIEKLLR